MHHDIDVEEIKELLKQKGYKLTSQRSAVLDVILQNEGLHLTVEEIYDKVKEINKDIGLATVYRTVLLFEEIGTITKLEIGDKFARYELVHKYEEHQHHHLICNECKKVIEVSDDLLDVLESNIEKKYNFKIQNHTLKFYGLCEECKQTKDV